MLKLVPKTQPQHQDKKDNQVSRQRFQLAQLLRITEEMLICAQEQDWESVEAMEKSRHVELEACFDNTNREDSPIVREALATLIVMNEQLETLVKAAKKGALAEQSKLQSGKAAVASYQL